jgi:hypothetical protein
MTAERERETDNESEIEPQPDHGLLREFLGDKPSEPPEPMEGTESGEPADVREPSDEVEGVEASEYPEETAEAETAEEAMEESDEPSTVEEAEYEGEVAPYTPVPASKPEPKSASSHRQAVQPPAGSASQNYPNRPTSNVRAIQDAIEDVNRIVDTLRDALDEMEEVLEMLELFERQGAADEREIESLRRALRQLQRPRDGGQQRRGH